MMLLAADVLKYLSILLSSFKEGDVIVIQGIDITCSPSVQVINVDKLCLYCKPVILDTI